MQSNVLLSRKSSARYETLRVKGQSFLRHRALEPRFAIHDQRYRT